MKEDMKVVDWIAYVLLLVGGLNLGLAGVGSLVGGNWNVLELILGGIPVLRDIVYILIGLSALYAIYAVAIKK